jgi:squalene cyclase
MRQQEADGDWPQQHISGVFNRNCMITYANYRWQPKHPFRGRCVYESAICIRLPHWTAT